MDANRKPTKARVFVRVRPFSDAEATVCPEDSPVPREVVTWDSRKTLTVLDAANSFAPRKNGQFDVDNVLWSFRDEENPKAVLHTQKDVYASVVAPMIPDILEGYSTAFCIAGAASSGRMYSLYGDDVDDINRGILPRFADDIFNAFKKEKRDNCTVTCEIEAVEITAQETYVDLLAQRRRSAAGAPEEPKLVNDPSGGPRLQGVTRVEAGKTADILAVLRQLSRSMAKRSTCHTVYFRFVETYEFEDPEQAGQTVSKSRRINVMFAMLRSMPPAFQRCIDVAVEHDSGENPLAKVPTRETAFTKLYPDLLQQGFNLAFLCCVSPYYEHTRETLQTLVFSTKVSRLLCKPKLLHDEALMELRNLSDEVKNLKTEVIRQSESMDIVQKEINAREVELMKQEATHHKTQEKLRMADREAAAARHAIKINLYRTKQHRGQQEKRTRDKKRSMAATKSEKEAVEMEAENMRKSNDATSGPIRKLEQQVAEQEKRNAELEERLKEREAREEEMRKMEWFAKATPEEQRKYVLEVCPENEKARQDIINLVSEEKQHAAATAKHMARQQAVEKDYATVYEREGGKREKESLQKENAQLEKEIAEMEAEIRRLQFEVDKRPPGCGCILM